jgi:hypothetical protein
VTIYYAKGYTERIGYDWEWRQQLGGLSVEKVDHSCRRETLADVRRCRFDRRIDGEGFVRGHAHGVMKERKETHDRAVELVLAVPDHLLETQKVITLPSRLLGSSARPIVVDDLVQHF